MASEDHPDNFSLKSSEEDENTPFLQEADPPVSQDPVISASGIIRMGRPGNPDSLSPDSELTVETEDFVLASNVRAASRTNHVPVAPVGPFNPKQHGGDIHQAFLTPPGVTSSQLNQDETFPHQERSEINTADSESPVDESGLPKMGASSFRSQPHDDPEALRRSQELLMGGNNLFGADGSPPPSRAEVRRSTGSNLSGTSHNAPGESTRTTAADHGTGAQPEVHQQFHESMAGANANHLGGGALHHRDSTASPTVFPARDGNDRDRSNMSYPGPATYVEGGGLGRGSGYAVHSADGYYPNIFQGGASRDFAQRGGPAMDPPQWPLPPGHNGSASTGTNWMVPPLRQSLASMGTSVDQQTQQNWAMMVQAQATQQQLMPLFMSAIEKLVSDGTQMSTTVAGLQSGLADAQVAVRVVDQKADDRHAEYQASHRQLMATVENLTRLVQEKPSTGVSSTSSSSMQVIREVSSSTQRTNQAQVTPQQTTSAKARAPEQRRSGPKRAAATVMQPAAQQPPPTFQPNIGFILHKCGLLDEEAQELRHRQARAPAQVSTIWADGYAGTAELDLTYYYTLPAAEASRWEQARELDPEASADTSWVEFARECDYEEAARMKISIKTYMKFIRDFALEEGEHEWLMHHRLPVSLHNYRLKALASLLDNKLPSKDVVAEGCAWPPTIVAFYQARFLKHYFSLGWSGEPLSGLGLYAKKALPRDVATYLKLDQSQDEIRVTAEEKQKFKEEQERFPDCANYYPGKESSELVASWTAYSILQCGVVHYHTEQLFGGDHVPVRKAAGIKIQNRVGAVDRSQAVSIILTDEVYDTSAYINHISADGIVDSWTRTSAILVPNTSCGQIKLLVDRLRDFQGGAEVVMKYDEDRQADTCGADRLMRFLIATLKKGEERHLNDMPVVKTGKTPGTEHRRMFTDADILAEIHWEVGKHPRIRSNLNIHVADFGEISERFASDQLKDYHTLRLVVRGEYPKRQTYALARAWPHYFLDCDHLRFYFMLDFGNNAFMRDDLESASHIMNEAAILKDNYPTYWADPITFMGDRVGTSRTIERSPYFLRYYFRYEYEDGPEVNEEGEATNDRVPHTPKPRDPSAAQKHKSAQGSAKAVPNREQRRTSQSSRDGGELTESEDSDDEDVFTVKKPRANPRGEDPRPPSHLRKDDDDGDGRGGSGGPVGGSAQRGGARRSNVSSTPITQKRSSTSGSAAAQSSSAQSGNSKQSKHSDDTEYYDPMDYAFDRTNPVESPSKANVLDEILERLHKAEERLKEDRPKQPERPRPPIDETRAPTPAYILLYPAWPGGPYTAKQRALLDCLPMLYYQNLDLIKEQNREKDKLFFRPFDKLLKPFHSVVSDAERLDQSTTTIADTITILLTTAQGRNAPHGLLLDAFNAPSTWSPTTFKLLTDSKQEAYRRAAQGVELPKRYETPHHKEFERCTMALADLILHLMERFHQPIAADRIKEAMKEVTLRTPHFGDLTTVYETLSNAARSETT